MVKNLRFNKLVRDKIPVEIQKTGGEVFQKILSPNEFLAELVKKISEEAKEINSSLTKLEAAKELADLYEVISAIQRWFKIPDSEIQAARRYKNQIRGAFEERVFIDRVQVPDGLPWINHHRQSSGRYREIRKNNKKDDIGNFQVGVVITLVNETNKILLAKRSDRVANAPGRWETISGRIASRESPQQAVRREIAEELGKGVRHKIIEPYYAFRLVRDDGHEVIGISFCCKYIGGEIKLNSEHTDYRWVSIDQAVNLTTTPGLKKELRYFKKKYLPLHNSPRPH